MNILLKPFSSSLSYFCVQLIHVYTQNYLCILEASLKIAFKSGLYFPFHFKKSCLFCQLVFFVLFCFFPTTEKPQFLACAQLRSAKSVGIHSSAIQRVNFSCCSPTSRSNIFPSNTVLPMCLHRTFRSLIWKVFWRICECICLLFYSLVIVMHICLSLVHPISFCFQATLPNTFPDLPSRQSLLLFCSFNFRPSGHQKGSLDSYHSS